MELSPEEMDELEQLLLYTLYPDSYNETPIDHNILLNVLEKVANEQNWKGTVKALGL
jgi:hypothetical protein